MSDEFTPEETPESEPAVVEPTTEPAAAEPTAEPTAESAEPTASVTDEAAASDGEATTEAEADADTAGESADTPLAALLRRARDAYADATKSALAAAGLDDVPKNGADVLDGLRKQGDAASSGLTALLGTSKQAVSQLIDTLELRGYLDRHIDPEDRRKLIVTLTERGQKAAEVIEDAVQKIDAELTERVGEETMAPLHKALAALGEIRFTGSHAAGATEADADAATTDAGTEAAAPTADAESTAVDVTDEAPAETTDEAPADETAGEQS